MADFLFISPTVKFKETDLSTRIEQLGTTALALIGETTKGRAFSPTPIRSKGDYLAFFGAESTEKIGGVPKYPMSFAANRFLDESNNLTAMRILGLSGYRAGNGWGVRLSGGFTKGAVLYNVPSIAITGLAATSLLEFSFYDVVASNAAAYNHIVIKSKINIGDLLLGLAQGESVEFNDLLYKNAVNQYKFMSMTITINAITTSYDLTISVVINDSVKNTETDNTLLAVVRSNASYTVDTLNFKTNDVQIQDSFTPELFSVVDNGAVVQDSVTTTRNTTPLTSIVTDNTTTISMIRSESESVIEDEDFAYFNNVKLTNFITPNPFSELKFKKIVFNKTNNTIVEVVLNAEDNVNFTYNSVVNSLLSTNITYTGTNITVDTPIVNETTPFILTLTGNINVVNYTNVAGTDVVINAFTYPFFFGDRIDKQQTDLPFQIGFQILNNDAYIINPSLNPAEISVLADNIVNFYEGFNLSTIAPSPINNAIYSVSFNPDSQNFISKIIGTKPNEKNTNIYVEKYFPESYKKIYNDNTYYGVKMDLVELDADVFTNYRYSYKTAQTPYIVSQLSGNSVNRLFKFVTITDGNAGNKDVKISISNINPETGEFDVIIRAFGDTDRNVSALETFSRCTMNERLENFIGKRIGQYDVEAQDFKYTQVSKYVYLIMADAFPQDAYPAGFEGYSVRNYVAADIDIKPVKIEYKKNYTSTDRSATTYLGLSETAFNFNNTLGTGINQKIFDFFGDTENDLFISKTKGFHMDVNATGEYKSGDTVIGSFDTGAGAFGSAADVLNPLNVYNDRTKRKFTLLPQGGFDGWDEHRLERTNSDIFATGMLRSSETTDYAAYEKALTMLTQTQEFDVTLLATPNIDWGRNLELVRTTLSIVEQRGDLFYIIDAPDLRGDTIVDDTINLLASTNLDSSYGATYSNWVEILTTSQEKIFLPPSVDIVRAFALNDKRNYEWFAVAGENFGRLNILRTRRKLSETDKDRLYLSNVNAIMNFNRVGNVIFGQKTLQKRESLLDRINVRRLMINLRRAINIIGRSVVFNQNDEVVRAEFEDRVRNVMDNVVRNRGVAAYKLVGDGLAPEVVSRQKMLYKLEVKPINALEFIGVEFILSNVGVEFVI